MASSSSAESFIEDISVVWFDQYINDKENEDDVQKTKLLLRQVSTYVVFFTDAEPFFNYIQSIGKEKILLVTSGSYALKYLATIHPMKQIDSISIFCMSLEKYLPLKNQFEKISGVFTKQEDLLNSLLSSIDSITKQEMIFGLFDGIQRPTRYLTRESASFLWFQLLTDVLKKITSTENSTRGIEEMLEYCQIYYRGNQMESKNIEEFRQTYDADDAIVWYSKQSFVYRLVNKALRTEDIDVLYRFRVYITDLRTRLAEEHQILREQQSRSIRSSLIRLYRGIKMTREEILQMRDNIGGLISMNGFCSTSRDIEQAIQFAKKGSKQQHVVGVLLEIDGDLSSEQMIFADISQFSVFPNEKEVLFDLGTVFRIVHVEFDKARDLWIMQLTGVDASIFTSNAYIQSVGKESEDENSTLLFGRLMCDMGEYEKAEKYFQRLLTSFPLNDSNIPNIHFHLGRVSYFRGQYQQALDSYEHALKLQQIEVAPKEKSFDIARTLHNIGTVYLDQKQINKALKYYEQALEMKRIVLSHNPDHPSIATSLSAIGSIHKLQGHLTEALDLLEQSYEMKQKALPADHPSIADSLNSLGTIYQEMDDYEKALECFKKSLKIKENSLPSTHPSISATLNNMAIVFRQEGDYNKALICLTQALQIEQSSLSSDSLDLADTYNNLCSLYCDQKQYDKALQMAKLKFNVLKKNFPDENNDELKETKEFIEELKDELKKQQSTDVSF